MGHRDLIVIGASAGGVEALRALVGLLPADIDAVIAVVVHIPPSGRSALPAILARAGRLRAVAAAHDEVLQRRTIYVAPPDHHLLIAGKRVRVTRGPRVNGHRPAIDPLFRSAASWAGPRVIGVILSGTLDDGMLGLGTIARSGGPSFVQDPKEATYPSMPTNALAHVPSARALPIAKLAEAIVRATREEVPAGGRGEDAALMADATTGDFEPQPMGDAPRRGPSGFTCPECNGALWEIEEGKLVRYQCHVGHGYGDRTLLAAQSAQLEDALWAAFRALKENAHLATRLADRARRRGLDAAADAYERGHVEAIERATLIERVLERGELAADAPENGSEGPHDEASGT